ncbi:MAG: L-seryl-tRNA(Sec) selenium transferase, partial [Chloroflexota bacterium]|nr:L-seryl-tRNA(Sec) selenium transferase [Chloroflexota bacterium]
AEPARQDLAAAVVRQARALWQPTLAPVINATGVIIHTNLGRAPLSRAAMSAMLMAGAGYSNLEFDLASGERGLRQTHLDRMLARLVGAESSMAVNNNAAAVLLALSALAKGKEVIVSRGQAVEIGGRFRIPDVMRQSGCKLVEVGTTNRTRLEDYAEVITPGTAALLHVHTSNFRVVGFTEEVEVAAMVSLGRQQGIPVPVIDDLGSGALLDTARFGLAHEPTVQESVAAGASVVCFSGDKLLGGPQAGLIVGGKDVLTHLRRHPLSRALRVDKCTIAALQATLLHYVRGEVEAQVPVWRMISMPLPEIRARADGWAALLQADGVHASVVEGQSTVGGGSLPGEMLPTWLLAVTPAAPADARGRGASAAAGELAARLRRHDPPVVARVDRGLVLLDPRTVGDGEGDVVLHALRTA